MKVLLFDDFDRTDSPSTPNPPSDGGQPWQEGTTGFPTVHGISGNQLYSAVVNDNSPVWRDCGTPNHRIKWTVYYDGNALNAIPCVGISDDENFIYWIVNVGLSKIVANSSFVIALFSVASYADGDVLEVERVGNTFNCYQNGIFIGSGTDAFNNTATGAGIALGSTGARADDCTIFSTMALNPSAVVPFRRFQGFVRA